MERFRILLELVDIALVSFLFYRVFLLVRGTRAAQMFFGLALLMGTSIAADILGLGALNWIVSNLKTVWVIAFVILFQPELRRALAALGQNRLFRNFVRSDEGGPIGEIVQAANRLAEQGQGALIVIEREAELRAVAETGTRIESRVTSEILETIFTPPTPLHDGAVLIRGNQLVAAGCILPLTTNPRLAATVGTRHRAALGITEETDAVVVIVSEETRSVSLSMDGRLRLNIDRTALRGELASLFVIQPKKKAA
ncbi:MAG: diadenylate cyclase CdaA [Candidatus Krumholzibacteriia bacterium]